jgi:enamidase
MNRRVLTCAVVSIVVAVGLTSAVERQAGDTQPPRITAESLWRDLEHLSGAPMEGRAPGTDGHGRARQYLTRRFKEVGLEPVNGSYEQPFTFTTRRDPGTKRRGTNVIGIVRGSERPEYALVLTAHYDHLGVVNGQLFPGANDNASGVAALLALASSLESVPPRHTFIIAALDAEENGLHGARALLESPPVNVERLVMNVNLDMVGRDARQTLYASGTRHYPFLRPYLERLATAAPVKLVLGHDGPGGAFLGDWTRDSDHYVFHVRGIPFIYFGVEDRGHHHKADDTFASMMREFYVGAVETVAQAVRAFDAEASSILARRAAPRPSQFADQIKGFIKTDARVIALTNARVIDGTGAPARGNQTLVLRDGAIAQLGEGASVAVPEDATVIDLTGKSVIPGLVMLHEHLYYPTGAGVYAQLGASFVRLYLAGGVTTMRTGGNVHGVMDLKMKRLVDDGQQAGPAIDPTAPYLNGPNTFLQMRALEGADDAQRQVSYWADMGATSFKAYMNITRAELAAAIGEAHARGLKVTGHLCSVTYAEAADSGIDNLEHGFLAATDFVTDKEPDACPGQSRGQQALAQIDETSDAFKALVQKLVAKGVALTSTLTVFETLTPGRPVPPGLDLLAPELKEQFERVHARVAGNQQSLYGKLLPKAMALERAFAKAGGLLVAGTDPTGAGGVIPGYSNHRQLELLVEAGFTPLEAISIGTLNGAKYLGRDARIGTIDVGKQADLVVVDGDPSQTISDVRRVETVFKQGVGYDPAKLRDSVRGKVGFW